MSAVPAILLAALLIVAIYMVFYQYSSLPLPFADYFPSAKETPRQYTANTSIVRANITTYTPLLFQNIRFGRMPVKFYLDLDSASGISWFDKSNVDDVVDAFGTWSNATGQRISFARTSNASEAQITVKWNISLPANVTSRAVGEGGPTSLIDTGLFNLTLKGEMNILPAGTRCIDFNRALHELGHVLGFDHTDDPSDIMFPLESCSRGISDNEINTLKSLYSLDPKPQFYLYNVAAFVHYGYLDMNFTLKNIGVAASPETEVDVYSDGGVSKNIHMPGFMPGNGVSEQLENIRIEYGSKNLSIVVDPEDRVDVWYRNLTYVNITSG